MTTPEQKAYVADPYNATSLSLYSQEGAQFHIGPDLVGVESAFAFQCKLYGGAVAPILARDLHVEIPDDGSGKAHAKVGQYLVDTKLFAAQEASDRKAKDALQDAAHVAEVKARLDGDTSIQEFITFTEQRLSADISAANQNILFGQQQLAFEVSDRKNADALLATQLAAETKDRSDMHQALSDSFLAEVKARSDADVELRSYVDSKSSQQAIDTSVAITSLQQQFDTEKAARLEADSKLGSRVDFIVANTDQASIDSLSEIVTKFNADGLTYANRLTYLEAVVDRLTKGSKY